MRVLVTGGTGFTGKALVKRLLDTGHQVVALDNKEGIKTDELNRWGAQVVIGSVTDVVLVGKLMKGIDVVHHLAAAFRELDVPNSYYEEVNTRGTQIVLEAAQNAGVKRFIYCSTCGVHGNVQDPPANEDAPIAAADYYQQTKYEAEPIVRRYSDGAMKTVILRPAAIYGPGDPERFGMIFRRVAKGRFPIFGDGRTLYHPLYIDSFIDVFMAVMNDGMGDGQVYLIADEHFLEIEELVKKVAVALGVEVRLPHLPFLPLKLAAVVVEMICKPIGVKPPIFPRRVDWYIQNRAFDIAKAKRELNYRPTVGIDEGLRRTADWYRAEGYLSS